MSRRTCARFALAIGLTLMGTATVVLHSVRVESRSLFSVLANDDSCGGILKVVAPARYVTPSQLAASNTMLRRAVDGFAFTTADGGRVDWPTLSGGAAVLVIFVKVGCPCSVEFEPYFHRLYDAYRGTTRFLAVIDGDAEAARRYAKENAVPYPVVADREKALIHGFDAKNGGYAALVDSRGAIVGFWPGFSADAMSELGRRVSVLSHVAERPIATAGLPKNLTSGCPFDVALEFRKDFVTSN